MFIGGYVSIAGGLENCIDRIVSIGGNCLMTFASPPRTLKTKAFSDQEINSYLKKKSDFGIGPHFFHGVYLINLATESSDYLHVSIESLNFYQKQADRIGAAGTILHIGSHKGRGFEYVFSQVCMAINQVVKSTPSGVKLILENAAGHAGTIGDNLWEIKKILHRTSKADKIGVCLDTQHAFASGYPIPSLLDTFDRIIGLEYLTVIHLNDSQVEFGTRHDRHANWGQGKIPLNELKQFVNDPRIKNIPLILEVPGEKHSGPRKLDLDLVKSLVVQ